MVAGLGPGRISPTYGLLDASGAGLVAWLAEIGIAAENDPAASWSDVTDAAGYQPMLMGGRAWCHWTGVRIWAPLVNPSFPDELALANPAPGYQGVSHRINEDTFLHLGPFSAVWFAAW